MKISCDTNFFGPVICVGFDNLLIIAVLRIRIRIRIWIHRIHIFLGLLDPDPDPLVRGMDPDPSIIMQKK